MIEVIIEVQVHYKYCRKKRVKSYFSVFTRPPVWIIICCDFFCLERVKKVFSQCVQIYLRHRCEYISLLNDDHVKLIETHHTAAILKNYFYH